MERIQLPSFEIPSKLYRIHYAGSQTGCDDGGFWAVELRYCTSVSRALETIESHVNWWSNEPSPWISTFSNRAAAENWALTWKRNNNGQDCDVVEIDGSRLLDCLIVRVRDVLHPMERPYSSMEYLVLHHVPQDAIVRWKSTRHLEVGMSSWESVSAEGMVLTRLV
ncbi:MAG: hypothetical protein M1818_001353 [Claussenomyces sp. TS43310]|nr:MAG: hypothetical protein M1818_001353 [Claussenomyces sp. TS43310]